MKFFLRFFDRIGFQWDGDVFLRAEALGAEQRIGADASVLARDKAVGTAGMECPDKGRKGGEDGSNGANCIVLKKVDSQT